MISLTSCAADRVRRARSFALRASAAPAGRAVAAAAGVAPGRAPRPSPRQLGDEDA